MWMVKEMNWLAEMLFRLLPPDPKHQSANKLGIIVCIYIKYVQNVATVAKVMLQ